MEKIIWRFLSLSVGTLISLLTSCYLAFNLYCNALKQTFNYTQSEVELSSSFIAIGTQVCLPATLLFNKFGPRMTITVGFVLGVSSYVLLFLTTRFIDIFVKLSGVIAILHFTAGHSFAYVIMVSVLVNVDNFGPNHRGKVLALVDGLVAGGVSVIAVIYNYVFVQGHIVDAVNQRMDMFFLAVAGSFLFVWILGMIFLQKYPLPENDYERLDGHRDDTIQSKKRNVCKYNKSDSDIGKSKYSINNDPDLPKAYSTFSHDERDNNSEPEVDRFSTSYSAAIVNHLSISHNSVRQPDAAINTDVKLYKTINIYLVFWVFIMTGSLHVFLMMNTTTILHSLHQDDKIEFFTTAPTIIALILNFALCSLVDLLYAKFKLRTSIILFILSITLFVSHLLMIFFIDTYLLFVIACIASLTVTNCNFSLIPAMLLQNVKSEYLGTILGIFYTTMGLLSLIVLKIFGAIYDSNIDTIGTKDCFGAHCFAASFVVSTSMAFSVIIVYGVIVFRKW